ncbi:MAG: FHA domain-containing protein, partial [Polyangiales bacterium]
MTDTNAVGLGELSTRETVPRSAPIRSVDSGRAVIVLTTGDQTPQVVEFGTRPTLTVGRAEPADVCVVDPGVSRLHVRFSREVGGLRVIDLGSRNGTWVRGLRITEALLVAGDSVVIGNTSVLIQLAVPSSSLAAPLQDGASAVIADLGFDEPRSHLGQGVNLRESLREHEAKLIREALRSAQGNQRRAAALLELPLRTFERKLRNMNLRQQA